MSGPPPLNNEEASLRSKYEKVKKEKERYKEKVAKLEAEAAQLRANLNYAGQAVQHYQSQYATIHKELEEYKKREDKSKQLKADNAKLKEDIKKMESCSATAQAKARENEKLAQDWEREYYALKSKTYESWKIVAGDSTLNVDNNKNDASDEDDGSEDDDDDDDFIDAFWCRLSPQILYFKCPFPSCNSPAKKALTLDKTSPKATAIAYSKAAKRKIIKDGHGGTILDITTEKSCNKIKKFAKKYGHSKTAIQEAGGFLRKHYDEWHKDECYPHIAIRDHPYTGIKDDYLAELEKQTFKDNPDVSYDQFKTTWYETKKGATKPLHNINHNEYMELLIKAFSQEKQKEILISMATKFWKKSEFIK